MDDETMIKEVYEDYNQSSYDEPYYVPWLVKYKIEPRYRLTKLYLDDPMNNNMNNFSLERNQLWADRNYHKTIKRLIELSDIFEEGRKFKGTGYSDKRYEENFKAILKDNNYAINRTKLKAFFALDNKHILNGVYYKEYNRQGKLEFYC